MRFLQGALSPEGDEDDAVDDVELLQDTGHAGSGELQRESTLSDMRSHASTRTLAHHCQTSKYTHTHTRNHRLTGKYKCGLCEHITVRPASTHTYTPTSDQQIHRNAHRHTHFTITKTQMQPPMKVHTHTDITIKNT